MLLLPHGVLTTIFLLSFLFVVDASKTMTAIHDVAPLICHNLVQRNCYGFGVRVQELLSACSRNVDVRTFKDLQHFIFNWLISTPKQSISWEQCRGENSFLPFVKWSQNSPSSRDRSFLKCLCDETCAKNVAEARELSQLILRQFLVDFFSNDYSGNIYRIQDNIQREALHHSVGCLLQQNEGSIVNSSSASCCYMFNLRSDEGNNTVEIMMGTSFCSSKTSTTLEFEGTLPRCITDIATKLPLRRIIRDYCAAYNYAETEPTALDNCIEMRLARKELCFQLNYNELSVLEMVHLVLTSHQDICEEYSACSFSNSSSHAVHSVADMARWMQTSMIPVQLLILLLNLGLFLVMYRGRHVVTVSKRKPLAFLCNTAVTNMLSALADLTSVLWFLMKRTLSTSPETATEETDSSFNFSRHLYCCGSDLSLESALALTAHLTPVYHVYVMASLVGTRWFCIGVSCLTFVAFGVFQIVPLLRPFQRYNWLKHPRRVIVAIWFVSVAVVVMMCGVLTKYYIDERQFLTRSMFRPGNMTAGHFGYLNIRTETDVREKNNLLRTIKLATFSIYSLSLLLGALASAGLIALVLYVRRNSSKLSRSHSTPTVTSRTVKILATIGLAQMALLISFLPYLVLTYQLQTRALQAAELTEHQLYLEDAVYFIRFYFGVRLAMLLEPLASPILILLRYDNLVKALWQDIRSQFNGSLRRKLQSSTNCSQSKIDTESTENSQKVIKENSGTSCIESAAQ